MCKPITFGYRRGYHLAELIEIAQLRCSLLGLNGDSFYRFVPSLRLFIQFARNALTFFNHMKNVGLGNGLILIYQSLF